MTWLKDITAVFSPFIAVPPNDTGGIDHATDLVNGHEDQYVEKKGDIPLGEFLDSFFKDSPWRVSVKKLQGKEWFVWQRVVEGKPVQPMIYLAPVSEDGSPFILRRPSSSADLLMITFPEDAFKVRIDDTHTLRPTELIENGCDFPTYIVVPQELKSFKVTDGVSLNVMWRVQEDGEYKKYSYSVGLADYSGLDKDVIINGFPGILYGVDTRCYPGRSPKPPPPPDDNPPPVTSPVPPSESASGDEVPPFPYGETGTTCLIYDASGSAARYILARSNKEASKMVTGQAALFLAKHIGLIARYYKEYPEAKVDEELKKIRLSFRIYFINENETAQRDVAMSLADVLDLEGVKRYAGLLDVDNWSFIEEAELAAVQISLMPNSLIKEGAVNEAVRREVEAVLGSAAFFVGADAPEEVMSAMWTCSERGSFIYFTDEASDVGVSPPAITMMFGRLPKDIFTETAPAEDGPQRVETAYEERTPLFISIALDDRPLKEDILSEGFTGTLRRIDTKEEALEVVGQASPKETELFTAMGRLADIVTGDRAGLYERLMDVAKDKRYDVHVAKRAIALIALWAIKGDLNARDILFKSLVAADGIPSSAGQVFLAKSVAEIVDDADAEALLKKITKDPEGRENYLYLIALSSNDRFLTALQFMMDHVWTYRIIKNQERPNLLVALAVLFSDPVVRYEYPKEMKKEVLNILAGGGWTPERLQDTFEAFAEGVLPALTSETAPAAGLMAEFAIKLLQPKWVEKRNVALNPIPKERYFYRLEPDSFENSLGHLVKDAKWEEGWLTFNTHDGSVQIETGLLSSIGSTVVNVDWKFAEEKVSEILKGRRSIPLLAADYHIHPWHDTSIPVSMSKLPSGADLRNWFGKLCEIRSRYPEADVEFRVVSPVGVTVLRPKDRFLEQIDMIVKHDTEGRYHMTEAYAKAVAKYEEDMSDYLGTSGYHDEGLEMIKGYFEIKFPREEHGR